MVARDKEATGIAQKVGRPSKLTDAKRLEILTVVRTLGFSDPTARKCGIDPRTLDAWLKRGDEGEEPYASFRVEYLRNQAEWEAEQLSEVRDPRWLLERQNPRVYAPPKEAGVSVNVSQTQVSVDHAALREAQLEVLRALERDPQYLDGLEDGEDE